MRIRDPDHPDIIIDDPLIIRKKLTSYWSNLGTGNQQRDHEELKEAVESLKLQPPTPGALSTITLNKTFLRSALSKLRNGKATGKDNIPGEFLKHGGQVLENALVDLFAKIKVCEKIPSEWYEGIVKPLHKDGNKECLNNYRGITISSIVYKLLVTIIEDQAIDYVEDENLLGEFQGAFRRHRRCEDQIFNLKGICTIRKSKKQKTYLAFLDVSKAFDTVDRDKLFLHLWNCGIQGKAWCLINMLYARVDNKVIFGPFESDMYEVQNGVKQGCVLSPLLFNLVVADFDSMLQCEEGVTVGDTKIRGLYYADDIVLFAKDELKLQDMLNVANVFAKNWNLTFNDKKSQVLIIGKRLSEKQWYIGEMTIKETKYYKYLGIIINRQLKDNDHFTVHIESKAKKLNSYVRYTLANHLDINRVQFGNAMWHNAVLPSLTHASAVWFESTKKSANKLKSIQYQLAKAVLKLRCMPASTSTIAELGWLPISDYLNISRIAYFCHLHKMEPNRLPRIIFNELDKLYRNNTDTAFNYIGNIRDILVKEGLDHMFDNPESCNTKTFKSFVTANYQCRFNNDIMQASSLKYFCMVKENTFMSSYLQSRGCFKGVQLKFKLRNGVSGLGEDLLRQKRGTGMCGHCGCFESLKHFLFFCPAYNSVRIELYKNLRFTCDTNIYNMFIQNFDFAICMLLGDHDDVLNGHSIKCLTDMWRIRDSF